MPPKRVWIPLLCLILLGVMIYIVYQQVPDRQRHQKIITSSEPSEAGLDWLQRHQSINGSWDARFHQFYCDNKEPINPSSLDTTLCYTSLALLTYLASGYDHKTPGKYKNSLELGIRWLVAQQAGDGSFSLYTVEQALATTVLCECYAMTMDPGLKSPAQLALNNLCSRSLNYVAMPSIMGWSPHIGNKDEIDFTVTAWCVMSCKSAKSAGLDLGDIWDELKVSYQDTWDEQQGLDPSGNFAQRLDLRTGQYTGVDNSGAALALIYMGKRPGEPILDALHAAVVNEIKSDFSLVEAKTLYLKALTVCLYGGRYWKDFFLRHEQLLNAADRSSTCLNGSVPPEYFRNGNRFINTIFQSFTVLLCRRYERILPSLENP